MTITTLYLYDTGFAEYWLLYAEISVNVYEYETKKTQFVFIMLAVKSLKQQKVISETAKNNTSIDPKQFICSERGR